MKQLQQQEIVNINNQISSFNFLVIGVPREASYLLVMNVSCCVLNEFSQLPWPAGTPSADERGFERYWGTRMKVIRFTLNVAKNVG